MKYHYITEILSSNDTNSISGRVSGFHKELIKSPYFVRTIERLEDEGYELISLDTVSNSNVYTTSGIFRKEQ